MSKFEVGDLITYNPNLGYSTKNCNPESNIGMVVNKIKFEDEKIFYYYSVVWIRNVFPNTIKIGTVTKNYSARELQKVE